MPGLNTAPIAIVVEEFLPGSPAQQLVDRLLMGFPSRGGNEPPWPGGVRIHAPRGANEAEISRRAADWKLARAVSIEEAAAGSELILAAARGRGNSPPSSDLLEKILRSAREGARLFVPGVISGSREGALRISELAASRRIALLAGGPVPFTWRLPPVDVEHGAELKGALVITAGERGEAVFSALDALLGLTARRRGGESGVRSVKALRGENVWKAREAGEWDWDLFSAALSRTDTPQGDAVKDGRTQDLAGLGLVPGLAQDPAACLIEHADGLRSAVLVLNGVVADLNFAVRTAGGGIVSAQLYRPPPPASHEWSALARVLVRFFSTGKAPCPGARSVLAAGLQAAVEQALGQPGERIETPALQIPYMVEAESGFERE